MFKDEYWDYDIFEGTFGLKDGTLGEDKKSLVLAFGETTGETGITGKSTQGLTNVFDSHYRTFASGISAPGRSFQLGLNLKL